MHFIKSLLFLLLIIPAFLPAQNKPKVMATASMISDMAENIAGGHLDVQLIVPIGGDPHLYDPTPSDVRLIAGAQLILRNGLTFEGWLNALIDNSGTKATIVTVTEGVSAITSLQYANATDPHAWMDVANSIIYIKNIKDAFIKLDPAHQSDYESNYNSYKAKLESLDTYIMERIKSIPERQRILITSHDAFQYYGRRYGIRLEAILGTSTDAEAQTSDIMRINKIIQEDHVPAVFIESTVNPKLLKQLAADNNILIGGKLYADSIGDKDSPAPTYLDMMKYNTDVIVEALSKSKEENASEADETDSKGMYNFLIYSLLGLLFIGGFFIVFRKMNKV